MMNIANKALFVCLFTSLSKLNSKNNLHVSCTAGIHDLTLYMPGGGGGGGGCCWP